MQGANDNFQKHRVIGIRHVLRAFKKEGLVESDSLYAQEGVEDVQDQISNTALRWYKKGARRGALVLMGAILRGDVTVRQSKSGAVLETMLDTLPWPKKRIRVLAGRKKITKDLAGFGLEVVKDLEFKPEN
ncbi:MAG: hypothetical protein WAO35_03190 [Terriglobia bacterium]